MPGSGLPRLVLGGGASVLVDSDLAEYAECTVPVILRHQVRALWQVRALSPGTWRHPVFPDGYSDVVVTGALRVLAVGPSHRAHHQPIPAESAVVGARLRPGALSILTGMTADDLCGRVVRIGTLEPAGPATGDVMAALVAFLGQLTVPHTPSQVRALRACELVSTAVRAPSIRSVADALGISERSVRSVFAEHVGLPPSTFHQIRRLQRALVLGGARRLSLAEIAHRSGYSDQAHLCRQMRTLTGLTPGSVLSNVAPDPRALDPVR
ncbi:AraC family transcriptional regulator [Nonomuraea sp. NPDC000554]|uniref:helix-turn-helix domain-containing protein n=1 Tax=Nonomuraea sp. NPDC000554 TaxID=3154259 RepID=UPI00331D741F